MDRSAFIVRILLGLLDPEDPSKRRELFNQQHSVTSQKSWNLSNTTARISPLAPLDVFVLEFNIFPDVRRLSWPNAVIMLQVFYGGGGGGDECTRASFRTSEAGSYYLCTLANWCTH